jgi:hypothetical protein
MARTAPKLLEHGVIIRTLYDLRRGREPEPPKETYQQ